MNIIYNLNDIRILESYLCFSERCMLLMFLTSDGWLDGYLYELLSEFQTRPVLQFLYQMGLSGFTR